MTKLIKKGENRYIVFNKKHILIHSTLSDKEILKALHKIAAKIQKRKFKRRKHKKKNIISNKPPEISGSSSAIEQKQQRELQLIEKYRKPEALCLLKHQTMMKKQFLKRKLNY